MVQTLQFLTGQRTGYRLAVERPDRAGFGIDKLIVLPGKCQRLTIHRSPVGCNTVASVGIGNNQQIDSIDSIIDRAVRKHIRIDVGGEPGIVDLDAGYRRLRAQPVITVRNRLPELIAGEIPLVGNPVIVTHVAGEPRQHLGIRVGRSPVFPGHHQARVDLHSLAGHWSDNGNARDLVPS